MKSFPFYRQLDAMDCGPSCLRMVARHYGVGVSLEYLRAKTEYGKQGASLLGLANAAEALGFHTVGAKLSFEELVHDAPLPAILHWNQYHFVVLTPQSKPGKLQIADPAKGLITLDSQSFKTQWLSTLNGGTTKGIALLLQPTDALREPLTDAMSDTVASRVGWVYPTGTGCYHFAGAYE